MVDIEFSTGSGTGLIDRLVCSNTRCTRPALYTFHVLYTYILSTWPPTNQPPDQYQLLQRSISPATDCQLCGTPSNGTSYRVGHRGTFLPANKPCIMALKRGEILKARPPTPRRPSFSLSGKHDVYSPEITSGPEKLLLRRVTGSAPAATAALNVNPEAEEPPRCCISHGCVSTSS